MGLHTGEASERAGDYLGPAVNRAARLMASAQGGQILTSSTTSALIDNYDLRPLGEHWLKDLGTPDRISQVLADGVETEFAPIHGLHVVPNNLPVIDDALIGRATDSETVADLLTDHQLVTIVGVGGIGKTRLALDVAASSIDSFTDGVWYCELANAGTSEAVAQSVADVLGIKQHPRRSLLDSMAQVLHDKTLLLILDNCEHVLEATSDLAETLGKASPDLRILATSREPLIVASAQVYPLPSLKTTGPDSPASQLFTERARQARPGLDTRDPHTRQRCLV